MERCIALNNLVILQGKVISKPIFHQPNTGSKILKFILKIPKQLESSGNLIPGTFETVSVFRPNSKEKEISYIKPGGNYIVIGRITNIRSHKKIYSDKHIGQILESIKKIESRYLNAPPEKRKRILDRLKQDLPRKVYPDSRRSEILAFKFQKLEKVNYLTNYVSVLGNIVREKKFPNRKKDLELRVQRHNILFNRGLLRDKAGFDLVTVRLSYNTRHSSAHGSGNNMARVMGRLSVDSGIRYIFNKKRIDKLIESFLKIDINNVKRFRGLMKAARNIEPDAVKDFEVKVRADNLVTYRSSSKSFIYTR